MPQTQRSIAPGTPAWLRSRNDRTALGLLLEHGELTRQQIGELTGLSKPTASQMVQRLTAAGVIREAGEISAGRGPNAVSYGVQLDVSLGVAIDIEERSLTATVVDVSGAEREVVTVTLPAQAARRSASSDVRAAIAAACTAAGVGMDRVTAVCVGVQGAVDPRTDALRFTDTLPGWQRTNVRARLEDELGIAVTIENDVNLAAVAERTRGAGRDSGGFGLFWLGKGLGFAQDVGGVVQPGVSGGAGELGYLPIPRDAADLAPSALDLQDLIGGGAFVRLARAAGAAGRGYAGTIERLAQNATARSAVIDELAPRVAFGIIPVLALLDPEKIVLGGPTGVLGGVELANAVAANVRRTSRWPAEIVTTGIPDSAVLLGACERLAETLRAQLFDRVDLLSP